MSNVRKDSQGRQLSDAELEKIAGGGSSSSAFKSSSSSRRSTPRFGTSSSSFIK